MAATVPVADSPSKHWPVSLFRRPDGVLDQNLSAQDLRRIVERGEGALWVDIDSSDVHQHTLLEKVFQFHPLAIEDTLLHEIAHHFGISDQRLIEIDRY